MSRLDSFIRRLEAQRACLEHAVDLAAEVPGVVFELGLGNGRTYDHLRCLCPGREIFVFDRQVAAHPDCVPTSDRLFLGDINKTLPRAAQRFPHGVALVHSDLGSGDVDNNVRIAHYVSEALPLLLAPGAVIVSDQRLDLNGAENLPLPNGVNADRYYLLRYQG